MKQIVSHTLSVAVLIAIMSGCFTFDKTNLPPHGDESFPPIAQEYYHCKHCGSLDGGIYGKGPTRHFRTEQGKTCTHDWQLISRDEFIKIGTERFHIDWSQEIPFWQQKSD